MAMNFSDVHKKINLHADKGARVNQLWSKSRLVPEMIEAQKPLASDDSGKYILRFDKAR